MSKIIDSLPQGEISVEVLKTLSAEYLDTLGDILHIVPGKEAEEVPIATLMPYHIFQAIAQAIRHAELLSQLVIQKAQNDAMPKVTI